MRRFRCHRHQFSRVYRRPRLSLRRAAAHALGFHGEIRAVGDVHRDVLAYMQRCGVNAFDFDARGRCSCCPGQYSAVSAITTGSRRRRPPRATARLTASWRRRRVGPLSLALCRISVRSRFHFFLIFTGAAVLASMALYTRQPLIVAYIVLGACHGTPRPVAGHRSVRLLADIAQSASSSCCSCWASICSHRPSWQTLRKSTWSRLLSSALFLMIGYGVAVLFGFSQFDALIVGAAMMFSSTIIGIKLLPTTVLHHRHIGDLMIGLLLLQDLLAIIVLMLLLERRRGACRYVGPVGPAVFTEPAAAARWRLPGGALRAVAADYPL